MTSLSQRKGIKPIKSIVQIDSMDDDLRNSLWNALQVFYWADGRYEVKERPRLELLLHFLWRDFFKQPVDDIPKYWNYVHRDLKIGF